MPTLPSSITEAVAPATVTIHLRQVQYSHAALTGHPPRPQPSRPALWITAAVIVLGLGLRLPSLGAGFRGDDYVQLAALQGRFVVPRSSFDLFRFAGGPAAQGEALRDFGYHPWWAEPELRLAMLRPLSSALIAADHALFGMRSALHHTHSLIWLALLLAAAAGVLLRLLPPPAATLALALYAVEGAHNIPTVWLANRSTLLSTCFGFCGLWLHLRTRQEQVRLGRLGTALLFSLSFAAGEYGLSTLGYVVAYELLVPKDSLGRRFSSLLPALAPALVYLGLRASMGYGVQGSGYYLSPLASPGLFASAATQRIPAMTADLLLGLPARWIHSGTPLRRLVLEAQLLSSETWHRLPEWATAHAVLGGVAMLLGWGLLRGVRQRLPQQQALHLAFLSLGALLSLLPVAGGLASDRLLGAAALGVSALLAQTLLLCVRAIRSASKLGRAAAVGLALSLAGLHLAWAAVQAHTAVADHALSSRAIRRWSLNAKLEPPSASRQEVYVIAPADFTATVNLPWLRLAHGHPVPAVYRRLSPAYRPHDLTRLSSRALELRVLGGSPAGTASGSLYRRADRPLLQGERFELRGLAVQVLQTLHGQPYRMRFEFDHPLEDPRYLFVHATPAGLQPIQPPPLGETIRLRLPRVAPAR